MRTSGFAWILLHWVPLLLLFSNMDMRRIRRICHIMSASGVQVEDSERMPNASNYP
ncbi:hypothetical protein CALVIDRAFT_542272 [Calocera viscosa TUFC12733]|uniref:Uncharacterized protein n=1 Tax=Calocera viscosa (strain TUFC12733) TaxID=1330018 RepID=A0A167GTR9_CALVF|nr:hypothetical protein CALVIDRAFT_542272 [Calocera viscosa TUFC12733]